VRSEKTFRTGKTANQFEHSKVGKWVESIARIKKLPYNLTSEQQIDKLILQGHPNNLQADVEIFMLTHFIIHATFV
jgi:hypothetical protein